LPRGTLIDVRALGIDYGRKRIGLALSDVTGLLARPWKTLDVIGRSRIAGDLVREVQSLRDEPDGLEVVVIGLPRRLSGERNDQTPLVEALAAELRTLIDLPIVLQDERLSSYEAETLLSRREKDWRKRKPLLDSAAAAVILQDYLDSRPRSHGDPADPPIDRSDVSFAGNRRKVPPGPQQAAREEHDRRKVAPGPQQAAREDHDRRKVAPGPQQAAREDHK
jgi:putative Holliday junction resolvase